MLRLAAFFGGIVLSTVVASLAVAPFAAYHFHKSQQFAILANLVAIPICNLVVMPAGLATLVVMPLGLEALPLAVMAWGIDGDDLGGDNWSAALPGAVVHIPAISDWAFGLMVAGGIWLALWRTRWRALGLGVAACGLALAPDARAPRHARGTRRASSSPCAIVTASSRRSRASALRLRAQALARA